MVLGAAADLASWWQEAKLFLRHSLAFSLDALHVIVGVVLMVAAALLLRKPLSTPTPWLVVFIFAFVNEIIDLYAEQWPHPAMQYGEGVKDLLLTMMLPTLLLLTSRSFPRVYEVRPSNAPTKHSTGEA